MRAYMRVRAFVFVRARVRVRARVPACVRARALCLSVDACAGVGLCWRRARDSAGVKVRCHLAPLAKSYRRQLMPEQPPKQPNARQAQRATCHRLLRQESASNQKLDERTGRDLRQPLVELVVGGQQPRGSRRAPVEGAPLPVRRQRVH